MQPNAKQFATNLNKCLDDAGAPIIPRERATILSKSVYITKQQARSLLDGHETPDCELLKKIAEEFEVDTKWLAGHK